MRAEVLKGHLAQLPGPVAGLAAVLADLTLLAGRAARHCLAARATFT
jgi:hypothetical protein